MSWWKEINQTQRNALIGGLGGWMLDAADVMLYVMALTAIMSDLHLDTATAGLLASVMLFSSAFGGIAFGVVADRYGRKFALICAVSIYTVFTALSGTATNATELAIYRTLLGLGMGGTWASGALLVAETWPDKHRGKASGFMQGGWAIGYMLAALLAGIILPLYGWRVLFFIGVIPSILMLLFIIFKVKEPQMWLDSRKKIKPSPLAAFRTLFRTPLLKIVVITSIFTSFVQLGYWGLFTWLPGFMSTPVEQGGAGMDIVKTSGWVIMMQVGALFGYSSFGFVADKFGRKKAFALYLLAAALVVVVYGNLRSPLALLIFGPLVGFFGSGFFSGFGVFLAELFPTSVRGTAQGLVYNFGRGVSAFAPVIIGALAQVYGIGSSLMLTAVFFVCGASMLFFLPETAGKKLE